MFLSLKGKVNLAGWPLPMWEDVPLAGWSLPPWEDVSMVRRLPRGDQAHPDAGRREASMSGEVPRGQLFPGEVPRGDLTHLEAKRLEVTRPCSYKGETPTELGARRRPNSIVE